MKTIRQFITHSKSCSGMGVEEALKLTPPKGRGWELRAQWSFFPLGKENQFSLSQQMNSPGNPLMEYLIKTYSNPGDTVLDNCMGSGTTGVACMNTGRNFIGIEKDREEGYFQIAKKRITVAYEINSL